jgi:NHLM bacteriocin system ABC transporter ATP-binding protein
VIGERRLEVARGAHAALSEPRTLWRITEGYVSIDVGPFDPSAGGGERGFLYNAITGDLVPGGGFESDGLEHVVIVTAAADAQLERIDPGDATPGDREKMRRRFDTLLERAGAPAFAWGDDGRVRPFGAVVEDALASFGAAYLETVRRDRRREALRSSVGVALDRTALYREAFEASHILDRYPIPVDPADDDVTAAARIVVDRLGVTLVAPIKADRDPASAVRAIALASHLVVRRIVLRARWWLGEHGAMVAFAKSDGRPLALVPRRGRSGYEAIDPADPRVPHRIDADLAESIADVAYVFCRTLPLRGAGIFSLLGIGLRDSTTDIVRVLALGLVSGLLASVLPLAIAPLIDTVLPTGLRGILVVVTVLLGVTVLAAGTLDMVRNFSVVRVKTRLSSQMQQSVMYRLIGLAPSFYRRFAVGDLASRALGVDAVEQYLGDATLTAVLTAVFSLVSFGVILYEDPVVGAVCGVLAAITLAAFALQAALLVSYRRKTLELSGHLSGFVYQTLTGIAKIRAAAARNRVYVRWLHRFLAVRRSVATAHKIEYRFGIFASVWPSVATLCIIVTLLVARDGAIEPGKFFTILAAFAQMLAGLLALGYNVSSMVSIVPIYERLAPILDALPERADAAGDPGPLTGAISIRDVSFTYEGTSRPALAKVSQEIPAGSFVAIVGPSGSGKSTLLRLLLGFETPSSGSISYDDHLLDSLDIVSVRRQLGAVLQTAKLLPGSIFDNIAGNAILTRDEAWSAARRVGLAGDIEAMPMKLDTMIGANGAGLSGGQRQRIVIARAIAFAPKLLFFDEATSALDNATQAIVSQTMRDLKATRIVIAHRLSTVVDADRILVMEGGRIVQQGGYAELLAAPGPFKALAERQRL